MFENVGLSVHAPVSAVEGGEGGKSGRQGVGDSTCGSPMAAKSSFAPLYEMRVGVTHKRNNNHELTSSASGQRKGKYIYAKPGHTGRREGGRAGEHGMRAHRPPQIPIIVHTLRSATVNRPPTRYSFPASDSSSALRGPYAKRCV